MIRRIVGWVVLVPLCLVLIVFALANRQLVVVNFNPLVPSEALSTPGIGVPLFLVILNLARIVTHERFRKWRRMIIFLIFVGAGIASPSPDPLTMLMLGGSVIVLVEVAEILIYFNDKRWARNHPDLYAGLSDDEIAPVEVPEPVDVDSQ